MSEIDCDSEEYIEEEEENEISKIPKDILDYANKIADLQELLMNLSSENISDSIEELKANGYFDTYSLVNSFISHLLEVTDFRPFKIPLLCKFLNQLFEKIESNNELIDQIKKELILQIFLSISNPYPFPNESSRPNFLYNLYSQKVVPLDSIIEQLRKFIDNYKTYSEPIAWVVSYFIDLVPDDIINETKKRIRQDKDTNPIFLDFFNTYRYDDSAEKGRHIKTNGFIEILRRDDVETLHNALNPLFEYDTIIKPNLFESCWFIQREPSLILCSAYFGSVKCFKYLLLNHADVNKRDNDSHSLAQFAVAGGNVEIVRLVEQSGCNFSDTVHIATHFYQSEIFEWLHLTKFPDLTVDNFDRYSILHHAAYSGNISLLVKCINSGCDVNLFKNPYYRETPILKAAENGKNDALKILLSVPEIDPNIRCNSETPLMFAARNGRDECVKLLCASKEVDVNAEGQLGTALHYAAYFCQTDVVRILVDSKRIDISHLNMNNQSAYTIAKRKGLTEITKILSVKRSKFAAIHEICNMNVLMFLFWTLLILYAIF